MNSVDRFPTPEPTHADAAQTPALRLFALLERIALRRHAFSLQDLVVETGWPKPTLHRMLQQLEAAGLLQREGDGRHYGSGVRLRRLAENILLNGTHHGARHAVLRHLVDEVGESCNLTTLAGSAVVYLDRVETAAPLRFYLQPGSRVPVHCSASGKILLSQFSSAERARLLRHAPLAAYTPRTITDFERLDAEIERAGHAGYAVDDEEFLPGLVCVAVLVPPPPGQRSNLCVALQAPAIRLSADQASRVLPALRRAAQALARIESEPLPAGSSPDRAAGRGRSANAPTSRTRA